MGRMQQNYRLLETVCKKRVLAAVVVRHIKIGLGNSIEGFKYCANGVFHYLDFVDAFLSLSYPPVGLGNDVPPFVGALVENVTPV